MSHKINLKYATNRLGLFSNLSEMKKVISDFKKTQSISEFIGRDEKEIGRGKSYAVFPELKNDTPITVDKFRKVLADKGIENIAFQNKILSLTLQNRVGMHFVLGSIIYGMLDKAGVLLIMKQDYQLELDVKNNEQVDFLFKATWGDPSKAPREPAVNAEIMISISPDKVEIKDFSLTKVSDNPTAIKAYNYLRANQQNILMKLITFIKHLLGYNSELRLEEKEEDDKSWAPENSTAGPAAKI